MTSVAIGRSFDPARVIGGAFAALGANLGRFLTVGLVFGLAPTLLCYWLLAGQEGGWMGAAERRGSA